MASLTAARVFAEDSAARGRRLADSNATAQADAVEAVRRQEAARAELDRVLTEREPLLRQTVL